MANRKVYFYSVHIFRVSNDEEVDYQLIKDLFKDIIDNKAKKQSTYRTLDLTLENELMHVAMDVYRYKKDRLFCRLSKQKPKNSMSQRDYATFEHQDILPGKGEDEQGIEAYTYCNLNYSKGILSIISAQGAPNEKALCNAISKYSKKYYIDFIAVPNTEAISAIYLSEESAITKVEIEIPVPPEDIMQQVLHWDSDEITATVAENALTTLITVKPPYRSTLTNDSEDTQNFIDCIKRALPNYKRAKLYGKAKNIKTREYDLFAEYFSYPIDIPHYHIENYKRVWFTLEELITKYDQALRFSYRENSELIEIITGR